MAIQALTPEQRARFPEFVEKWTRIVLSTERADRKLAEHSISGLYQLAGLAAPMIVWTPCPRSGLLTAFLLALCDFNNLAYVLQERAWITRPPPLQPSRGTSLRSVVANDMAGATGSVARQRTKSGHPWKTYCLDELLAAINARNGDTVRSEVQGAVGEELRRGLSPIATALAPVYRALRAEIRAQADLAHEWSTWWGLSSFGLSALLSAFNPVAGCFSYSAAFLAHRWVDHPLWEIAPPDFLTWVGGVGMPDPLGARVDRSASLDYMLEVLRLPIDGSLINLNKSAGWCWPLRYVCVVSERPTVIHRDSRGRLHCQDAPAIAYENGWGLYHWHGVAVPESVIKRPQEISVEMIDKQQNAEVRRVMIHRYKEGSQSYLQDSGARLVHEDRYGKLWRKDRKGDTPLEMVEVLNTTPEADGSRKTYWLRVKPGFTSAHAAVAWTFGVNSKDYAPVVQT